LILSTGALVVACATLPVPEALTVARQRESLDTNERIKELAPQGFAHAVQLRERADAAYENGDRETAEVLAEHALAAFQHAGVQARMARAREHIEQGRAQLLAAEEELARVTQAQQATEARAKALELRVRVVRDAEPIEPVGKAPPARESARHDAAVSILEVARLLCLSARMLDSEQEEANRYAQEVEDLDRELAAHKQSATIDRAMTLRAECLRSLTLTRREARKRAPEADPGDVLLVQLKNALPGQFPVRDDRGVVVASSKVFDGKRTTLTEEGTRLTRSLADVAKANPTFPLLVVVHGPEALADARVQALSQALGQAGAGSARVHSSGQRVPSSIAPVKGSSPAASRVEFVLVAPH
jgi:tetratricopeptide (TPR) repeat protein